MTDLRACAERVARDVFAVGDEPRRKCNRIQFKSGVWPGNEQSGGGLCERALADVIESSLEQHLARAVLASLDVPDREQLLKSADRILAIDPTGDDPFGVDRSELDHIDANGVSYYTDRVILHLCELDDAQQLAAHTRRTLLGDT